MSASRCCSILTILFQREGPAYYILNRHSNLIHPGEIDSLFSLSVCYSHARMPVACHGCISISRIVGSRIGTGIHSDARMQTAERHRQIACKLVRLGCAIDRRPGKASSSRWGPMTTRNVFQSTLSAADHVTHSKVQKCINTKSTMVLSGTLLAARTASRRSGRQAIVS